METFAEVSTRYETGTQVMDFSCPGAEASVAGAYALVEGKKHDPCQEFRPF
jgi:hypothetical protein